jgi:hypothetical protein
LTAERKRECGSGITVYLKVLFAGFLEDGFGDTKGTTIPVAIFS